MRWGVVCFKRAGEHQKSFFWLSMLCWIHITETVTVHSSQGSFWRGCFCLRCLQLCLIFLPSTRLCSLTFGNDALCGRDTGNMIFSVIIMLSFKVASYICHAVPINHQLDSSLLSHVIMENIWLKEDISLPFRTAQHVRLQLYSLDCSAFLKFGPLILKINRKKLILVEK